MGPQGAACERKSPRAPRRTAGRNPPRASGRTAGRKPPRARSVPARPARPAALQPCAPCCPAAAATALAVAATALAAALRAPRGLQPCCAPCALQPCAPCCPAALRALRALQPCAPHAPCCPAALCALLPCSPVRPAALCAPCALLPSARAMHNPPPPPPFSSIPYCRCSSGGKVWGWRVCEPSPAPPPPPSPTAAAAAEGGGGCLLLPPLLPATAAAATGRHRCCVRWGSPGGGGFRGNRTRGVEAPGGVEATSLSACDSASVGAEPEEALHTFTLDSHTSRCFFRDSTTVTPLTSPVPVTLANLFGGPIVVRGATVLPCPAAPSGLLTGLHLPSFAKNLVATSVLQVQWVTITQLGGELMAICTDSRTSEHLATFTRRPGSGLFTLTAESALVAESGQVAASVEVAAFCSYCLLMHQTLLGPCPRFRGRLHRPAFPASRGGSTPLLTPPCFLLPLLLYRPCTWMCEAPPASLDRDFCGAEGIVQTYTLPASPGQNRIAERRIGLVMECVFLGFPTDAPPWQFFHPGSRRVLFSCDVTFDESVCFYRLHPHRSSPVPLPHLSLVDDPPSVAHVPPPGPAPSGVTQVEPPPLVEPLEVSSDTSGPAEGCDQTATDPVAPRCSAHLAVPPGFPPRPSSPPLWLVVVDSGAAGGGDTRGADSGGAGYGGAASPTGAGGAGGAAAGGSAGGGAGGAGGAGARRQETLSPERLHEWAVCWGSPGEGAGRARAAGSGDTCENWEWND
ncbi:unnamed protein product [Closterium sp. NIES-53]